MNSLQRRIEKLERKSPEPARGLSPEEREARRRSLTCLYDALVSMGYSGMDKPAWLAWWDSEERIG